MANGNAHHLYRRKMWWAATSVALASIGVSASRAAPPAEHPQRFEFSEPHMGTRVVLRFYAADADAAKRAATATFARVKELNGRLSDYQPDSELSRLSRTSGTQSPVQVSTDLWSVLRLSEQLWQSSDRAFDITAGPYVRLWRQARRTRRLPAEKRLAHARQAVGFQHVRLDPQNRTVMLSRPNMRLDLGGVAKGYVVDEALRVLAREGVRSALVDAGGDIAISDPPPGRKGWRIGVAQLDPENRPSHVLVLCRCGVATSGDAFQHVEIDGIRYSHLLDPRTGQALTTPSTVTVLAKNCARADGLASAVSVLGPDAGIRLIDDTCGAAAIIVQRENDHTVRYESARAKRLFH